MGSEINWLAIVLAAISSMVVGSVWYMPNVFGNSWMKMTKSKMGKDASPSKMAWMYGSVFAASIVTAWVLSHATHLAHYYQFAGNSYLVDALITGFILWLGFTATRLYVHDTFEERRKKLTLINAMHELVTILVMALIIGLMKP